MKKSIKITLLIVLIIFFMIGVAFAKCDIECQNNKYYDLSLNKRIEIIKKIEKKLDDKDWKIRQEAVRQLEKIYENVRNYGL